VHCHFGWREGENQPPVTGIDGLESQCIAEKCPVRLGVLAVDNDMSTRNHGYLLK
jgi:hypothetical protein